MAKGGTLRNIKRYAGSRLYDPGAAAYVTLAGLADMVEDQEDFTVIDAGTGEDVTQAVLKEIIVEHRRHG
jgi:polyhydroxyalkanoate synthesis repressor PhaR